MTTKAHARMYHCHVCCHMVYHVGVRQRLLYATPNLCQPASLKVGSKGLKVIQSFPQFRISWFIRLAWKHRGADNTKRSPTTLTECCDLEVLIHSMHRTRFKVMTWVIPCQPACQFLISVLSPCCVDGRLIVLMDNRTMNCESRFNPGVVPRLLPSIRALTYYCITRDRL